jgi:phage terminase large subunit-like protein
LRNIRDRGRPGGDPSLVYVEFCAPDDACADDRCSHERGTEGCAADDPEQWRKANPALGRRITAEYVAAERRALPVEEFVRERLGWWEDPIAGDSGIPPDDWSACANREAALDAPVVLALDVAPGHGSAAIVACGRALHVVDHHRSASWVVDRVVELKAQHKPAAIGLDPTGPAGALIEDLKKAGITEANGLVLLDGRSGVLACESFLSSVLDHSLVHRDEHALNTAVTGAGRRQVGDSWKWSRRDSDTDISPLVAATVARYLWMLAPPPPPAQVRAFWA